MTRWVNDNSLLISNMTCSNAILIRECYFYQVLGRCFLSTKQPLSGPPITFTTHKYPIKKWLVLSPCKWSTDVSTFLRHIPPGETRYEPCPTTDHSGDAVAWGTCAPSVTQQYELALGCWTNRSPQLNLTISEVAVSHALTSLHCHRWLGQMSRSGCYGR